MDERDLALLRSCIDHEVELEFDDGKRETVNVVFVSEVERDMIYEHIPKRDYASRALWNEIVHVRIVRATPTTNDQRPTTDKP